MLFVAAATRPAGNVAGAHGFDRDLTRSFY
eukprot:COSAG02_NODE_36013_length_460_cov_0.720222_1_plen_29_part_10